jgi:hypothetical protein
MTQVEIATKYGISEDGVKKISSRWRWAERRLRVEAARYDSSMANLKGRTVRLLDALDRDVGRLLEEVESQGRRLTGGEAGYIQSLYDRFQKEIHIQDGDGGDDNNLPPAIRGVLRLSVDESIAPAFNMFLKGKQKEVITDVDYQEIKKKADDPTGGEEPPT